MTKPCFPAGEVQHFSFSNPIWGMPAKAGVNAHWEMGMARRVRPDRLFVPALAFLLCGFIGLERLAIPEAKLIDPFWAPHDPARGSLSIILPGTVSSRSTSRP